MGSGGFEYGVSEYEFDRIPLFVSRGRSGVATRAFQDRNAAIAAAKDIDNEFDAAAHVPEDWCPTGSARRKAARCISDSEIGDGHRVWQVARNGFVVEDDRGLLPGWFQTVDEAIQAASSKAVRRPPGG